MKILQVHNFYRQAGGEDIVVASERSLLLGNGHESRLWSLSNESIDGPLAAMKAGWRMPYSSQARTAFSEELAGFNPDLVHVHNFFPLVTAAVYDACREAGVPVVQTLHNYRPICAGAMLMRAGHPCEECLEGRIYRAVLHGCYRGSRFATLPVARMIEILRRNRTWSTKIDRFIALTEFAKSRFVTAGFPANLISVKPNFVEDRARTGVSRKGALFVGRLAPEKGVHTLKKAWGGLDLPLRIVGEGPLINSLREAENPVVRLLGHLAADSVADEMARAEFLIMPSEAYETFGLVMIEAFCQGLPVIASRLGSMAEIVQDGITGLHFTAGDAADLAVKVRWAVDHPEEMRRMGAAARRVYEEKYTPDANYRQLTAIYEQAIASSRNRPAR